MIAGTSGGLAAPLVINELKDAFLSEVTNGASDVFDASKQIKNLGEKAFKKVFTATDGPVDLSRAPSASAVDGASESFGGTYVTEVDITNPENLANHTSQNIPFNFSREGGQIPPTISTIEAPISDLKPDPSVPNPSPGTFWIPPNNSAKVIEQHKVVGEKNGLPILEKQ